MFDPWAWVIELGIDVHLIPLERLSGCTDGTTIWLDTRLTTTERRCTLTHELVHLSRGHEGHQPPTVEESVRAETARLLLPWAHIADHAHAQVSVYDLAHELGVTPRTLGDRIRYASAEERFVLQGHGG
ncbi:ImmA/IrrE family metallo-endopeptidase [Kocuria carniphila]|uniref:ImmA/IrrE family metallo-endopeptidase n=1 Tax=Kocuria carniphila TaxID=262208 RepID=UPI0034CE1CFE